MNSETLYKMALTKWGITAQITRAIEECAELIKALAKRDRIINGSYVDDILEEMVDVEIMLEQLKVMFNDSAIVYHFKFGSFYTTFVNIKRQKLRKLEKLLNE